MHRLNSFVKHDVVILPYKTVRRCQRLVGSLYIYLFWDLPPVVTFVSKCVDPIIQGSGCFYGHVAFVFLVYFITSSRFVKPGRA